MEGEAVLGHPQQTQIDEMFQNGHTSVEVASYVKQCQKDKRLQISHVTLGKYRQNFLKLSRDQISEARREKEELGKTRDVTALTHFAANKDLVEAKSLHTQEIMKAVEEFRTFKDECKSLIDVIKTQTVDANGNPVFVARNFEILEKFYGRLESTNNSFIKAYKEMNDINQKSTTNVSITVGQVQKQTEVFKRIVKRILMEIDASLVNKFWSIYKEEMNLYYKETGQELQINVNTTDTDTNINIITQLPTPEEVKETVDLENENTQEHVIDLNEENYETKSSGGNNE